MRRILKNTIFYPLVLLKHGIDLYLAKKNPKAWICRRYERVCCVKLNLENPKTFHEKIIWLAFNTDTSLWSKLTDKCSVREYITSCGFNHILNDLYGVYNDVQSIDFHKLPKSFVMKTNNGCGTVLLVKDKNNLNYRMCKKKLTRWMKEDYGLLSGQIHYSQIKPQILIENFLQQDGEYSKSLIDYKFFCFHGEPKYVLVIFNRDLTSHVFTRQYYDLSWRRLIVDDKDVSNSLPKPYTLDEMLRISKVLSNPFPFVRIDMYEVNKQSFFGEMTFTPGFDQSIAYNKLKMGDMINLDLI